MSNIPEFWMKLIENLNEDVNLNPNLNDIFKDLCDFLNYTCAFYYQADHTSSFYLKDHYTSLNSNNLPKYVDLRSLLGDDLINEFIKNKMVSIHRNTINTPLEQKFSDIFLADCIVLKPILDSDMKLIAILGIIDTSDTNTIRHDEKNITYAISILTTLANYLKIYIYQTRIEDTKNALENIINNMGTDIYVTDFYTHEILFANESMAAPYGGREKVVGNICWKSWYDDKSDVCDYCPRNKLIDENGNPTKVYTWDYQRPFDGSWWKVVSRAFKWTDSRLAHVITSIDITESKKNEHIIERMANYDHLTNLPNRRKLMNDCDELSKQTDEFYVLFFDLDGFKVVNDSLGHETGDELLIRLSKALTDSPLTGKYSYRYGGDEFVILSPSSDKHKLLNILQFLQQKTSQSVKLNNGTVTCTLSIGVSHFPNDGTTTTELIRQSDKAMYHSKKSESTSIHFYNNGKVCTLEEFFNDKKLYKIIQSSTTFRLLYILEVYYQKIFSYEINNS